MIIGQDSDNKTYEPKLDICGTVSAVNMPAVQGNEASQDQPGGSRCDRQRGQEKRTADSVESLCV
ncbi:MAG: hypothetical protein ACLSAF_05740 [Intestinimonas sp.]